MCLWTWMLLAAKKSKVAIWSIKVTGKVTRSLTLVWFEKVSISWVCMPSMKSLSLTVQNLWPRLKRRVFCHRLRHTDRTNKMPQIPFQGKNKHSTHLLQWFLVLLPEPPLHTHWFLTGGTLLVLFLWQHASLSVIGQYSCIAAFA